MGMGHVMEMENAIVNLALILPQTVIIVLLTIIYSLSAYVCISTSPLSSLSPYLLSLLPCCLPLSLALILFSIIIAN